jgi:hypothetical protein
VVQGLLLSALSWVPALIHALIHACQRYDPVYISGQISNIKIKEKKGICCMIPYFSYISGIRVIRQRVNSRYDRNNLRKKRESNSNISSYLSKVRDRNSWRRTVFL